MKSLFALSAALVFASAAAVQSLPGVAGGRQLQPSQQEIDNREGHAAQQWDRRSQSEIHRLYDAIMRSSSPMSSINPSHQTHHSLRESERIE